MMKRLSRVLSFVVSAVVAVVHFCSSANAATIGIFETYAILESNGGGNQFYDAGAATGNPDFHGANFGVFDPAVNSLILRGAEVKTFKNNGGDVTGAFLAYRVWQTGNPSGSFTEMSLPFNSDLGGGDQKWQKTDASVDLLSGLGNGNYTLELYFRASGNAPDVYDSRGGLNYQATFEVVPEPTNIALGIFGTLIFSTFIFRRLRLSL